MPLKLLDGALKMEHNIGKLLTHGMKIGEIKDFSESEEEITNVESKDKLLLVFQNLNLKLFQLINDNDNEYFDYLFRSKLFYNFYFIFYYCIFLFIKIIRLLCKLIIYISINSIFLNR